MLGKEFVLKSDQDYSCLNKVVAENIDIKIPEQGEVVKRLVELAKERNINYIPSHEAQASLSDYCLRKEITVSIDFIFMYIYLMIESIGRKRSACSKFPAASHVQSLRHARPTYNPSIVVSTPSVIIITSSIPTCSSLQLLTSP